MTSKVFQPSGVFKANLESQFKALLILTLSGCTYLLDFNEGQFCGSNYSRRHIFAGIITLATVANPLFMDI
ncbi:hypothetical protein MKW98_020000 [Papaver atlanticum]|uniref:Uncharacterized protein n=1 Tax=Papaver atlanticum TaxID=357466 RepID=A0AAD4X5Y8_9MAGN|nr:hypothetical protein MKW98_020000 [Papaver atlanticum]